MSVFVCACDQEVKI